MQRNSYIVTRIAFIAVFIVTIPCSSGAQQQNSAVKNAYIITKMADKFHLQPRQLNDTFSKDVFNQLLRQTDEDKLIFTAEDIAALSRYASDIDDEIRNRQPTFLKAITNIYRNRAQAVDTMISNICRHPFDFSLPEKITAAEDTSYAAEKNLRLKIYKKL